MSKNKIHYYDRVRLRSMNAIEPPDESELLIQIVPSHEADASAGRISAEAPVGKAVLNRRMGDTVQVHAQGQCIPMQIVTVEKHELLV